MYREYRVNCEQCDFPRIINVIGSIGIGKLGGRKECRKSRKKI